MNPRIKNLCLWFVICALVMGAGTWEDWYGRVDYSDDAISYLDVSKAINRGDWTVALNTYWSPGYPMILSATRWMFPPGMDGEWTAIHVVDLVIYLAIFLSFLHFLRVSLIFTAKVNGSETPGSGAGFVYILGISLFVFSQVVIGNPSRVSPDPLISGLFFLVTATSLQFFMKPSAKTAIVMGLLMGFGFILKVIFLPISLAFLLVAFLHELTRPSTNRASSLLKLVWAVPAMALLAAPYVAALSKAYGSFTLGESGKLNYAWIVNNLPRNCGWIGGPAPFGMPIHPTHLVWRNPPVFTFAGPFPVTYPPWFALPYWYEGYHHFFSIKNQIVAIISNLELLIPALGPAFLVALALFFLKDRGTWWHRLLRLWPLYLPAIAALGVYVLVFVSPRYVVGFETVILIAPLLPLFAPTQLISQRTGYALLILAVVGFAASVWENKRDAVNRAHHNVSHTTSEQWQTGLYLNLRGIHPGEKVAAVRSGPGMHCTWAYVSGVHVVAEIGNDAFDPNDQDKDLQLFVSNPDLQQAIFPLFRQAGAVAVIALDTKEPPAGSGWENIPGTQNWIHSLRDGAP